MRVVAAIVAALAVAALTASCAEKPQPQNTSTAKLWQTGTRAPTVTLTEPAGGPAKG
ncbi:hypothetical protein [Prauserella muralis]|uniref:hypothetical protein n=1 Tax=Prauserella muralis TaxID=588067 RepID=UPI0011ABD29A|nr:hypothetical protein [Prauserella muralis]TWE14095.1 hypothetical protein FHX69_6230 [Prauserella muralis]